MTRWFLYRFSPWLLAWFTLAVLIAGLLTETGFKLLWGQLRHVLPDGIKVERVAGSLLVGPRVYGVDIQLGELRVQARSLEVDWSILAQFGTHWQVNSVRLRDLDLTLPRATDATDDEAPAPLQWPSLPALVVKTIDLGQIRVWDADRQEFQPQLQRLRARLEMQADQLAVDAALIRLPGQPPLQARLSSHWPQATQGRAELQLQILDADAKEPVAAPIEATVEITLAPQLQLQATASSAGFSLQPWLGDALEPLQFQGQLQWDAQSAQASLHDWTVDSQWQGHAVSLRLPDLLWNGGIELGQQAALSLGSARITVQGQLSQNSALDVVANIPAQMELQPGWRTPLELRAQVRGQLRQPWAVIYGHLQDWEGPDWTLRSGDLAGRLSLDPSIANQAVIRAQQGLWAGRELKQIELTLRGSIERLHSQWQMQAMGVDVQGQGQARLATPGQRQATLSRLDIHIRPWEQWRLQKPLRWTEQGPQWRLDQSCLESAPAQLCLAAQQRASGRTVELNLRDYSLQRLARWAQQPPSVIQGTLTLQATAEQSPNGAAQAQLRWNTSAVQLGEIPDSQIPGLQWAPSEGLLDWSPRQASVQWDWPLATADGGLQLRATLRDGQQIDNARLQLNLNDLQHLRGLLPEVQDLRGRLRMDVQAQGQLSAPTYQGQLVLDQASVQLITPGITLDPLRIQLDGNQEQLALQGEVGSGRGQVALSGNLRPLTRAAELRLQGQNFEVLRTDLGEVEISPELQLSWVDDLLRLSGVLRIPKANIHPASLPSAGPQFVAPSRDEIIVGEEPQDRGSALQLAADLRLLVDSNARFEGFGLKTNLRGDLRIRQEPERSPTANGTLELVDGSYKAYGQDLSIQRGRLIFSGGSLDEPGIDLRAFRQPRSDIRVGIQARGAVRKPEISLWSEPGMNQTEQLSWLVLGRSSQNLNQAEQSSMQNAALALGLKGSDFLSKRFKGKLGLDELSIGTRPGEETSQAALVLGKYLNPRLYVSYGIGLFEPIYSFRARYEISSKWTLQTESGVESGGDLVYTIER